MANSIFSYIFCLLFGGSFHPLHVSVTEINYNEKNKALEIMTRVFIDDLETTMRKKHNLPDLDILNPKTLTLDQMMEEYLEEMLSVTVDNKLISFNYLGHEREGEAFVFYVESSKVKSLKNIRVSNTILTDSFEDQSNLVHVTFKGSVKSLRLNKNNPYGDLSFNQK